MKLLLTNFSIKKKYIRCQKLCTKKMFLLFCKRVYDTYNFYLKHLCHLLLIKKYIEF